MDFCHIKKIHTNEKNIWDLQKSVKQIETDIPNIQTDITQIKSTIKPWFDIFSKNNSDVIIGNNKTKIDFNVIEKNNLPEFFVNGHRFNYACDWLSANEYVFNIADPQNRKTTGVTIQGNQSIDLMTSNSSSSSTSYTQFMLYPYSYRLTNNYNGVYSEIGVAQGVMDLTLNRINFNKDFIIGNTQNRKKLDFYVSTTNNEPDFFVNGVRFGTGGSGESFKYADWFGGEGTELRIGKTDGQITFYLGDECELQITKNSGINILGSYLLSTGTISSEESIYSGEDIEAKGDVNAGANINAGGNLSADGTLTVEGATTLGDKLTVSRGGITADGNINFRDSTTLKYLTVNDDAKFYKELLVTGEDSSITVDNTSAGLYIYGQTTLANSNINVDTDLIIGNNNKGKKIDFYVSETDGKPNFFVNGERFNSYAPIGDETVTVRGNDQSYEVKYSSIFTDSTLATVTNQMYITNESYYYKNTIPHVKLTIVFNGDIDYSGGDFFNNEIYIPMVGLKRNEDATNDAWGTYTIDSVLDNLGISDGSLSEVSTALDDSPHDHTRRANYIFTAIKTGNRPLSNEILETLEGGTINTVLILKADVKGDFEEAATAMIDSGNQNINAYDASGNMVELERTSVMYFDFEIPNGYTIDSENLNHFVVA